MLRERKQNRFELSISGFSTFRCDIGYFPLCKERQNLCVNRASLDRESLDSELWNSTILMNEMIFFLSTGFYDIKFRLGTFSFLRKSGKMFEIFFVVFKVSRFTILQFLSKKRFRHRCFTVNFAIKAFAFETFTNYSIRFQCTLSQPLKTSKNLNVALTCVNLDISLRIG